MATYLTRTFGTPTNATIWTLSFWCKRASSQSASEKIFSAGTSSTDRTEMYFASDGQFWIYRNIGGSAAELGSTPKYRDANAWYHFVIQNNNGTAAVYVNGESVTLSNTTLGTNKINLASTVHKFGEQAAGGQNFFGLLSHVHFADGTIYAPTVFGSTDSTTGEWKINTSPSFTLGNNGFTILKDANTITDQSTNSNDFTLGGGTLTKTEDCPSNVFATLNPLSIFGGNNSPTLSNGNTTLSTVNSDAHKGLFMSSLGMTQGSGKFYCEIKAEEAQRLAIGVCNKNVFLSSNSPDGQSNQAAITYYYSGHVYYDSNGEVSGASSFANNDILGIALDMENNRLFFHKNGTYMNSGDPTSSTGNVLTFTNAAQYVENHEEMFFFVSDLSTSGTGKALVNFGNGYFGTTAVSSAGTNASGNGIFEYDVPTGYTALSTKGLNL